jgi:hypothetical protein
LVNAHIPRIAQSIRSGSRVPRISCDSSAEKASATRAATVVVQATAAVTVRAIRARRCSSRSVK